MIKLRAIATTFLVIWGFNSSAQCIDCNVYIDQIGDNNNITVAQDGAHRAAIVMGKNSQTDGNTIGIDQKDPGLKTVSIELLSGINNGINITQQGTGTHTTGIMNLAGSANNITVNQSGAGNHQLSVLADSGTTNSANTITANQSGSAGADKFFQLNLKGSQGATVNILQNNLTTPDSASMNVQCAPGMCGTFSYTKN